jgi:uncharacterized protein involved in exopolysaccharide biosynthesis
LSERDYDNDEQQSGRPGIPVDPLRILNTLRRRWQLIVIAGVFGAFLGAAIAKKFVGSNYAASGIITWNTSYDYKPEEREAIVESMLFSSNLEEIKKRMKLDLPNAVLAKIITVTPSPKSNNIVIDSTWGSAEGAAQLVNDLIDVFLAFRQRIVSEKLKTVAERYRGAVIEAERQLANASKLNDEFRMSSGISDIPTERQLMIQQAAALSAQTDAYKVQADAAQKQLAALESGAKPSVGALPVNEALSAADRDQAAADAKRLPIARQEYEQLKLQYAADDPRVRRVEAEIHSLEARIKANGSDPRRKLDSIRGTATTLANKQKAAQESQAQLQARLDKLSAVEGKAAMLLGGIKVADEALASAKALLAQAELEAQNPPSEFRVIERAKVPAEAMASPRKNIAIGTPIGFLLGSTLLIILWSLRRLDVRTPQEAAFWSGVPVVGASTWPRDPDMLSSLMHDLDDYAPHCEGVTLIVGASLDEAHLARRVAEWDGHRMVKSIDDPQRLLAAGSGGSQYPLARPSGRAPADTESTAPSNMQILTLTGPVPAQALRRAARLADRVMVVVASGKHSVFQLMKIKGRLGREGGIGVLLVGLEKDYAMVTDRVGNIEAFWHATRQSERS